MRVFLILGWDSLLIYTTNKDVDHQRFEEMQWTKLDGRIPRRASRFARLGSSSDSIKFTFISRSKHKFVYLRLLFCLTLLLPSHYQIPRWVRAADSYSTWSTKVYSCPLLFTCPATKIHFRARQSKLRRDSLESESVSIYTLYRFNNSLHSLSMNLFPKSH